LPKFTVLLYIGISFIRLSTKKHLYRYIV